jgi:uncharacterized protein (DUF1810 family)
MNSKVLSIEERFLEPHVKWFSIAMEELKNGKKESCWCWYLLPTPPYLVRGVEKGSAMNKKYALRGDLEGHEYLDLVKGAFNTRGNYIGIVSEIRRQLQRGVSLGEVMGEMDAPKTRSSLKLFQRLAEERQDSELYAVCLDVLQLDNEERERNLDQQERDYDAYIEDLAGCPDLH